MTDFDDPVDTIDALFSTHAPPASAKKRAPREADLQEQIIDYLNSLPGVFVWKAGAYAGRASYRDRRTGAIRERFIKIGRPGVSDVIGWVQVCVVSGCDETGWCPKPDHTIPRFIALEVKKPGGKKPSEAQEKFLARAQRARCITGVVRSLADVKALVGR